MKLIASTFLFCLMSLSGFSQPVKYSHEQLIFNPGDKIKVVNISSQAITNAEGYFKYTATAVIDVPAKKILSVTLKEYGKSTVIALNKVTHINNLHLSTPSIWGIEAYSYKGSGTNMVFYFLAGASNSTTFEVLFYLPAGPQDLQAAN